MRFMIIANKDRQKLIDITNYSIEDIQKTYNFYRRAGYDAEIEYIN